MLKMFENDKAYKLYKNIFGALDMMNQLKMTKTGETEDGREKWDIGELPNKK